MAFGRDLRLYYALYYIDVEKRGVGYIQNFGQHDILDFFPHHWYNEIQKNFRSICMTYEDGYKRYRKRIENYIRYRLDTDHKDLAEDLTSEIFVILYERWDHLDSHEEARVLKWLYNAALIKIREHGRLMRKTPIIYSWEDYDRPEGTEQRDEPADIDAEAEELQYRGYIDQIKAELTPTEKETFECIVEKHQTIAQAAKELHAKEVTVKVRWYRIRQKIKSFLPKILK